MSHGHKKYGRRGMYKTGLILTTGHIKIDELGEQVTYMYSNGSDDGLT